MTIPVKLTEEQFQTFIEPHLSRVKRSYVCKIPHNKLFNYMLMDMSFDTKSACKVCFNR